MICPNCGAQNRDDAKFCKSCGTPLKPLARGAKDSLATVAGSPSTETSPSTVVGLEAVFLSGLRKGERVTITTFPATIGRDPNSVLPLALQDQLASTRHAQILHEGGGYLLRDVGSSNGTYLNGHRITEVWLKDADVIEFGIGGPKVRFDFIRQPEAKSVAPDRLEAATLPPLPAVAPSPSEPTISRQPTVGADAFLPPPTPAPVVSPNIETVASSHPTPPVLPMTPPPPPPLPASPPSAFESGATAVQSASAQPPGVAVAPSAYEAPLSTPPPSETGGGKSKLVLFIAIGGVVFVLLLLVVVVVVYFAISSK
ncbi:MAG: FHA domain-containing protein [Chloracidobacterium sp.]|nr:FHA domain-containing protein [Chloracidobacterium sp.]MDW8216933.1 FHA domain-containing protein [Acidobacteriota bacterium]